MNKIYKTKYSHTINAWVVVSEITKGEGKTSSTNESTQPLRQRLQHFKTTPKTIIQALLLLWLIGTPAWVQAAKISIAEKPDSRIQISWAGKDLTFKAGDGIAIKSSQGAGDKTYTFALNSTTIGYSAFKMAYKANNSNTEHDITMGQGFNFTSRNNENIVIAAKDQGELNFTLSPTLTGITSINNNYLFDGGTTGNSVVRHNQLQNLKPIHYFSVNSTGGGNYHNDGATGADAMAIGKGAAASQDSAVALGKNAKANVANGIALGAESVADRAAIKSNDVKVSATATGVDNKVFAFENASSADKQAIKNTVKGNLGAFSVGNAGATRQIINVAAGSADTDAVNVAQLKASQIHYFSVNSTGGGNYHNDGATGIGAMAIGRDAVANEKGVIAMGQGAGEGTIRNSKKEGGQGERSIYLGFEAGSYGNHRVHKEDYWGSVFIGQQAGQYVTGDANIGIGSTSGYNHTGSQNLFLGDTAKPLNKGGGFEDKTSGNRNIVFGNQYISKKVSNTDNTLNYINDTIVIGNRAVAENSKSIAIGSSNDPNVDNNHQIKNAAIGAYAKGERSIAIGVSKDDKQDGAQALGNDSIALGTNAVANKANAVALGQESTTAKAATQVKTSDITYKTTDTISFGDYAGWKNVEEGSQVSIGSEGHERQIKHVAPGKIAASSTDAINGSQLYFTNQALVNIAGSLKDILGGKATLQPPGEKVDGKITMENIGGTGENTIDNAIKVVNKKIKPLEFHGNTGKTPLKLGETLKIQGGLADTTVSSSNSNIRTVVSEGTVDIQFADAPTFTGKVSAQGLDAGGQKITNVAKGENDEDAVNFAQLKQYTQNISNQNLSTIEANSTFSYMNKDGKQLVRKEFVTQNPDGTQNKHFGLALAETPDVEYIPQSDEQITISTLNPISGGIAGDVRVQNVAKGTATNDAVNVSQLTGVVTALGGGAKVNNDGSIKKPSYTINQANGNDPVVVHNVGEALSKLNDEIVKPLTFSGDNTAQDFTRTLGSTIQIKGGATTTTSDLSNQNIAVVANKDKAKLTIKLAKNLTDLDSAVFGTEGATNSIHITKGLGKESGSIQVGNTIENATLKNDGLTIKSGPTFTKDLISANNQKITNVADGQAYGDAVNLGQLKKYRTTVQSSDGSITVNQTNTDTDGTFTYDIKVNAQGITNSAQLPVVYTKAGGTRVYKRGNKFYDAKTNGNEVDTVNIIVSMQNAAGSTTDPTTLTNIKGNLTVVDNTTTPTAPTDAVNNNAATVGDVLNAGFNLQGNGTEKDFVKAYDTVNFVDGQGTTATVTVERDGTVTKIAYDVATDNKTLTIIKTNANGDKLYQQADGSYNTAADGSGTKVDPKDISTKVAANTTSLTIADGTDPQKPAGQVVVNDADKSALATAGGIADAINNSGFTIKANSDKGTPNKMIQPSNTLTIQGATTNTDFNQSDAGQNIFTQVSDDDTITIGLAKKLKGLEEVQTGQTTMNTSGVTITTNTPVDPTKPDGDKVTISLTDKGLDNGGNKITNVADGSIAANSKDAVNGGQLFDIQQKLGTGKLTFAGDMGNSYEAALGSTITIRGGAKTELSDNNIGVVSNGSGILTVKLAKNLTGLESVTANSVTAGTGDNQVVLNGDGVNVGGSTYINNAGINANDKTITNVADGNIAEGSKDAVNGGQLHAVTQTYFHTGMGDLKTADENGNNKGLITDRAGAVGDNSLTAGVNAIAKGENAAALGFGAKAEATSSVALGHSAQVTDKATHGVALGAGSVADRAAIKSTDVKVSATADAAQNEVFAFANASEQAQKAIKATVKGELGAVSVGNQDANRQITGVAAGSADNDAVNVAQLKAVTSVVGKGTLTFAADSGDPHEAALGSTVNIKGGSNIHTSIDGDTVRVSLSDHVRIHTLSASGTVVNGDGIIIQGGPSMTRSGGINAAGHKIINVAPGEISPTSTDAVNGAQLHQLAQQVDGQIGDVDGHASAGTASAIASAGLPMAYLPGKSMVGAAIGTYRGKSAVAVGVSAISDNGKWVLKGSASANTYKNVSMSVGVGFQW